MTVAVGNTGAILYYPLQQMEAEMKQFPEFVQFRAPEGFLRSIAEAAEADQTKPSEFIRRAVADRVSAVTAVASRQEAAR